MPPGLSRFQAMMAAVTSSPWTRDLRHLIEVPRFWTQQNFAKLPKVKAARAKDRIKWWNIVPGDQVRVLGAEDGAIREVFRIHKLNNRVLLKKDNKDKDINPEKMNGQTTESVHYSRCQLFVGTHKFPPAEGSTEPRTLPVFATRISMATPTWSPTLHRYDWERYAVNTVPRLPTWSPDSKEKVLIPWPKPSKREPPAPSPYDTNLDAVLEITYQPPALPANPKAPIPRPPSEHEYIKSLKAKSTFSLSAPIEMYAEKELSNPWSRAKKQLRWQAAQEAKKKDLATWVRRELDDLQGRTRRGAYAEAVWKYKHHLVQMRKAELQRREVASGRDGKRRAKRARKAKKQERINRNLRELMLEEAANQVVPQSA